MPAMKRAMTQAFKKSSNIKASDFYQAAGDQAMANALGNVATVVNKAVVQRLDQEYREKRDLMIREHEKAAESFNDRDALNNYRKFSQDSRGVFTESGNKKIRKKLEADYENLIHKGELQTAQKATKAMNAEFFSEADTYQKKLSADVAQGKKSSEEAQLFMSERLAEGARNKFATEAVYQESMKNSIKEFDKSELIHLADNVDTNDKLSILREQSKNYSASIGVLEAQAIIGRGKTNLKQAKLDYYNENIIDFQRGLSAYKLNPTPEARQALEEMAKMFPDAHVDNAMVNIEFIEDSEEFKQELLAATTAEGRDRVLKKWQDDPTKLPKIKEKLKQIANEITTEARQLGLEISKEKELKLSQDLNELINNPTEEKYESAKKSVDNFDKNSKNKALQVLESAYYKGLFEKDIQKAKTPEEREEIYNIYKNTPGLYAGTSEDLKRVYTAVEKGFEGQKSLLKKRHIAETKSNLGSFIINNPGKDPSAWIQGTLNDLPVEDRESYQEALDEEKKEYLEDPASYVNYRSEYANEYIDAITRGDLNQERMAIRMNDRRGYYGDKSMVTEFRVGKLEDAILSPDINEIDNAINEFRYVYEGKELKANVNLAQHYIKNPPEGRTKNLIESIPILMEMRIDGNSQSFEELRNAMTTYGKQTAVFTASDLSKTKNDDARYVAGREDSYNQQYQNMYVSLVDMYARQRGADKANSDDFKKARDTLFYDEHETSYGIISKTVSKSTGERIEIKDPGTVSSNASTLKSMLSIPQMAANILSRDDLEYMRDNPGSIDIKYIKEDESYEFFHTPRNGNRERKLKTYDQELIKIKTGHLQQFDINRRGMARTHAQRMGNLEMKLKKSKEIVNYIKESKNW